MEPGPFVLEPGDACDRGDSSRCHLVPAPSQLAVPSPLWSPFPHLPPHRSHQMGTVATFLGIIIFLPGGLFCARSPCWQAPSRAPQKGQQGVCGSDSGLLHRTELVLLLAGSSVGAWSCQRCFSAWVPSVGWVGASGRKTLAGVPVVHPVRYATGWEISE